MTDTHRSLCDCSEPCACYAEGYAAGSGTETGSGTAFPEGGSERLGFPWAAESPRPAMPHPALPGAEVAPPDAPHETDIAGVLPVGPGSARGADAVLACAAHGADSPQGGASVIHCHLFNIP